jgi:hypothetical protein
MEGRKGKGGEGRGEEKRRAKGEARRARKA